MIPNVKSGKHLYSRGWLGLITLVGGIVGIGLIALGIFKYKDRRLIIIGTAALLFTITIYSSLFYYMLYSKQGRTDRARLSQPFMNSLIKNIEFYKIQNGTYPDILEEISATDKMVLVNDP